MKDPIVDEVRHIRLQIEQDCVKAGISYKDHLLTVQKKYGSCLVFPSSDKIYAKEESVVYESKHS